MYIRIATRVPPHQHRPPHQDRPKQTTRQTGRAPSWGPLQLGPRRSPSTFLRTTSARPEEKSEHFLEDHFGPSHSPQMMNLSESILRVGGPDAPHHSPSAKFSTSRQDTTQHQDPPDSQSHLRRQVILCFECYNASTPARTVIDSSGYRFQQSRAWSG